MSVIYKHKKSTDQDKRPTAAILEVGEISVNYNSVTPGLFIEDSSGDVVKVGPAEVGTTAPNSTPAGSSGNCAGELWYDTSGSVNYLKLYDGSGWGDVSGISFDASGNGTFSGPTLNVSDFVLSPSSTAAALTTDGEVTVETTDNTTLSVKHRGTDSATRTGRVEMNSAGGTFGICAHASFDGSAGAAFNWLTDTFASGNVSSITRVGTGNFQINFATPFANNNFTVVASAGEGTHSSSGRTVSVITRDPAYLGILCERTDTGADSDEDYIAFMVIGELV